MKAINDPVQEAYGMCFIPQMTEEFEKLIEDAKKKIEPFSIKDISRNTVYFKIKDEEISNEYDCCDNDDCIKEAKKVIRENYGKGTHVEDCYYCNDGDHERIEICSVCGKPLNEWLTWCDSELEYLEENKPWNVEFLKEEAFLINVILNSTPTMDCDISEYAKHNRGDSLKEEIKDREEFFQRIGQLAQSVQTLLS